MSNYLIFSDKVWQDYRDYNLYRSNVVDYYHASYEGNESFYNSIDIYSENDLAVGIFTADNTFFDTAKLKSIGEYSESVGYGKRWVVTEIYSKFSGNRLLILFGLAIIFIWVLVLLYKNRSKIKPVFPILLALIFVPYFYLFRLNYIFILALPLMIYVIVTGFICNRYHFCYLSVLSFLALAIIFIMNFIRLNFRVAFNIFFPTIVFLYGCFSYANIRYQVKKKNPHMKQIGANSFVVIMAVNIMVCVLIANAEQYRIDEHTDLSEYIGEHADSLFVCEKVGVSPYYNTPLIAPPSIQNNVISSGWQVGSPHYQAILEQHGAADLFLSMIDNSEIKLVIKDTDRSMYEDYFNAHYTNNVIFEDEANFNGIDVISVHEGRR